MKICVISYDFWDYDKHIVEALCRKGIDAHHIRISKISHSNFNERAVNALSKTFLKKNLKKEKRQKYVLDSLKKLGPQDQILVLNPDTFDLSTLNNIKKYTDRLITYLYDSLERVPVEDKLHVFDKVFSFDKVDIEKHSFEKLTNYIYLPYTPAALQKPEMDLFYITSYDNKRLSFIKLMVKKLMDLNLKFQIMVIGKKTWKHKLKNVFINLPENLFLIFRMKKVSHEELPNYYKGSKALLDLMREGQYGLSFRVFEAMALEKKIVTDNESIKNYDFYNPKNIAVVNHTCSDLDQSFFETPYEKIPEEIYYKYTIENWVDKVFDI
ncbi:glycosyltransferase family protein [Chryseobacterium sp. CT-SW4]|uniref:glycosyltransferase family protein n=1 Tax=Chryseobacterium sp. SW-1 TaxID=3157343 RepID=UPI003B022CBD